MAQDKIARRWQKRFRNLLAEIDGLFARAAKNGEAEVIHNLRVALRRARLLALAGRPALGREAADAFRHQAFQIMELLGGVRDADVTLDWLRIHEARPRLAKRVQRRRDRLWRATAPRIRALRLRDQEKLRARRLDNSMQKRLCRRYTKSMERFFDRLLTDKEQFRHLDIEGLHEFRRNLRRWRYLNETLLSRREQKTSRGLARLIALQDALGGMQNCEVIRQFLRGLNAPANLTRPLDQLLARQQRGWLAKAGARLGAVADFAE